MKQSDRPLMIGDTVKAISEREASKAQKAAEHGEARYYPAVGVCGTVTAVETYDLVRVKWKRDTVDYTEHGWWCYGNQVERIETTAKKKGGRK